MPTTHPKRRRSRKPVRRFPKATSLQIAVDLLDVAINVLRPQLDRGLPIKQRVKARWATAREAREYGASDVVQAEFIALARETGLINNLGRRGEEDARHVLCWAMRGLNPFEAGPLR
jgi:hypothetical protein